MYSTMQVEELPSVDEQDIQVQLKEIETFLRQESKHVSNGGDAGLSLFQCLGLSIQAFLDKLPQDVEHSSTIDIFTEPEVIINGVVDILSSHKKQFQSVINLLVENIPAQQPADDQPESRTEEDEEDELYETIISDLKMRRNLQIYTNLCVYAAATCLNTPIYIVCRNEFGRYGWAYFQPLFTFEGQSRSIIKYLTMAMTSDKTCFHVKSHETTSLKPKAAGLVGLYMEVIEDISPLDIIVPDELLALSVSSREKLCYNISREIVLQSCILFLQRRLIPLSLYGSLTADKAPRKDFCKIVAASKDAYHIICQVLISRRQRSILTEYVEDWNVFVRSCDYIRHFNSLGALDNAIISRNSIVSEFVTSCQLSVRDLDERRKTVTTTVIASSSVGIASGGMAIAGLVLAPFSLGTSLGLALAGGALGIGSGVTSSVARTYEAVKQNTAINDIKQEQAKLQEKENEVSDALQRTELLFQRRMVGTETTESERIGMSRRGFMAIGSAVRATHSVAHIALTAAKLGSRAAVLGPLSMVFDIAFLAEAAHNKANGDKTNAGEILQNIAETMETKSKIFNGMLRGDLQESESMQGLYQWN